MAQNQELGLNRRCRGQLKRVALGIKAFDLWSAPAERSGDGALAYCHLAMAPGDLTALNERLLASLPFVTTNHASESELKRLQNAPVNLTHGIPQ